MNSLIYLVGVVAAILLVLTLFGLA